MKIKRSLVVGCLTALLGVGAAVGSEVLAEKGQVKEAEAATTNASGTRIYLNDEGGKGFTYTDGDPHAYMTSITFVSGSGYSSVSDIKTDAFGGGMTKGSNYIDVQMQWVNGDSNRPYAITVPWYINSFTVEFRQFGNTNALYEKGNANPYRINATIGKEYKLYTGNYDGYGSWWDGSKYRTAVSLVTNNSYTYSETTYSITVTKSGTGTVTPSSGTYKKNQILNLTATPGSGWSFSSWSDSGAQNHSVYVTSIATYTATFLQLPALDTPVLTLQSDNRVTWNAISGATAYKYTIDGGAAVTVATSATREVPASLVPGSHTVEVWAVGDGSSHVDSAHATKGYTVADGYFLYGSYTDPIWGRAGAVQFTATGTANEYVIDSIYLGADKEAKACFYGTSGQTWYGAEVLNVSQESQAEYPVSVTQDSNKNLLFGAAGNYKITVNVSTYTYTVVALDYVSGYKITIGSTSYDLVYNEGNEYKALGVSVSAGQSISLSRKGSSIAGVAAKSVYNNNVKSNLTVYFTNASANIYYDVVTKKVWISLPVADGFHIVRNGNELIEMTPAEDYDGFKQAYSDSINFSVNDTLQFLNASSSRGDNLPELFNITTNDPGSIYGEDYFKASDGVMKCLKSVSTKVYMKLKSGYDRVYFGAEDPEVTDARLFAEGFIAAIGTEHGVCKADGSTDKTALGNAWQAQVTAFAALTEKAQKVMKDAYKSTSTVEEINESISIYRVVIGKYDETVLGENYNFLAASGSDLYRPTTNPLFSNSDSSNAIIWVVVASTITLAAVGGFFFIKRRKHDR